MWPPTRSTSSAERSRASARASVFSPGQIRLSDSRTKANAISSHHRIAVKRWFFGERKDRGMAYSAPDEPVEQATCDRCSARSGGRARGDRLAVEERSEPRRRATTGDRRQGTGRAGTPAIVVATDRVAGCTGSDRQTSPAGCGASGGRRRGARWRLCRASRQLGDRARCSRRRDRDVGRRRGGADGSNRRRWCVHVRAIRAGDLPVAVVTADGFCHAPRWGDSPIELRAPGLGQGVEVST